jgi:O-antigen biosynthesis protein
LATRARRHPRGIAPAAPEIEQQKYVWQRLGGHGAADDDAGRYKTSHRDDAVGLLSFEPRFALDVGCYTGAGGRSIKDAFPGCKVWGVEPDARAAELARRWVDNVIVGTFDTIDWDAQGIAGKIDTVFLLDVLEHMYNPWQALETLRKLVSAQAQLVISVPNVRNMFILRDLMNGYWRYRDAGLLDSTHIRFFSKYEAMRLIYQTGYRVATYSFTMNPETAEIYAERKGQPFPQRVEFEKGSPLIEDLAELQSFLATQHVSLARPETLAKGEDRPGTL